jgi:hypothetical protein
MGLVGAIALHALVFVSVGRRTLAVSAEAEAPQTIELEETPAPELAATPIPEPIPEATSEPAPAPANAPATAPGAAASPPGIAQAPASATALEPAPSSSAPMDFSLPESGRLSADQLGLGRRNVFLGAFSENARDSGSPAGASTAPDGTQNVAPGIRQSMRTALEEHDHELGFYDVGGATVGVAESVARPSDTPADSTAVFEITADAEGNVTSVTLVDATQGRTAWEPVAASLASALRAKRLAMRGHAGAVITLEVSSRWALPSGAHAGHAVNTTGAGPTDTGLAVAGNFDLSDIGARPARSVHARILHERYP